MMAFSDIARKIGKLAADNSPGILTAIGVTGTVTTAYLTGRASHKAAKIIEEEKVRRDEDRDTPYEEVTPREMLQLTWQVYIPAAGAVALTIAAIICANRVGTRRAAAMAAAYSLSERAFAEYKDKVVEKIGEKKEREVRDEIAQDRVDRTPMREVIIIGSGEELCYDEFTGRYFRSSVEEINAAVNVINKQVIDHNYASLTDFYIELGLEPTSMSDELGWSSTGKLLEVEITATMKDKRPCIAMDFANTSPIRDYYRSH